MGLGLGFRGFFYTHLSSQDDLDGRQDGVVLVAVQRCGHGVLKQLKHNVVKVRGDVGERHILVPHNLNLCGVRACVLCAHG